MDHQQGRLGRARGLLWKLRQQVSCEGLFTSRGLRTPRGIVHGLISLPAVSPTLFPCSGRAWSPEMVPTVQDHETPKPNLHLPNQDTYSLCPDSPAVGLDPACPPPPCRLGGQRWSGKHAGPIWAGGLTLGKASQAPPRGLGKPKYHWGADSPHILTL